MLRISGDLEPLVWIQKVLGAVLVTVNTNQICRKTKRQGCSQSESPQSASSRSSFGNDENKGNSRNTLRGTTEGIAETCEM